MAVKLHHASLGQGKPVIIIHGLLGSSRNWSSFAKKLSGQYQVITLDLRNHGNSSHADSMTYAEMASDILQVMEEFGLDRASLIGHSMGGKVAMTFALQHRSMVEQLVIMDIAPVSYKNELLPLLDAMTGLPLKDVTSRKHADTLLAPRIPDDALRLFLLQNLTQDADQYRWRINLQAIRKSLIDIDGFPAPVSVKSHPVKALFLGGEDSGFLKPHHYPIVKKYFPKAQIHIIEGAGHWLHIDRPDKVLERVQSFLGSEESTDPPSLLYRT